MQIIYLTINKFNKEREIKPYYYLGSDENNNPKYFGSNKKLKKDISLIGIENFEKIILYTLPVKVSNVKLRYVESIFQKNINCAKNEIFYNRTNTSWCGYFNESTEEKKERMKKCWEGYKKWKPIEELLEKYKSVCISNGDKMRGKTLEDIHGLEKANIIKENMTGEKNPCSKYQYFNLNDRESVRELYLSGEYHKLELANKYRVSLRLISEYTKGIGRYENRKSIKIKYNGIDCIIYK